MEASNAGSKILVVCEQCGKKMGLDASLVGRSIKCSCGHVFKAAGTPVATAKPTAAAAASPANAKAKTRTPPPPPQPSFLDHLTETDFSRPANNPYDPPAKDSTSETAVLRKYAGTDAKIEEENRTAKTNVAFLAVINFIGAALYFGLGVLILVLSSALGTVSEVLPLAALGAAFAAFLFCFGLFDLVSGIGLVKRQFWGWWICIIGLSWSAFDRAGGLALRVMNSPDWSAEIPKLIGAAVFMFSSLYFLNFMCQKRTMKMFKVDVSPAVGWAVAITFGLLLGGVGFGIAMSATSGTQAP